MKITKKFLITGLSVAMLTTPFFLNNEGVSAKAEPNKIVATLQENNKMTEKQVVQLAAQWAKTESHIQMGGNYKEGEYKTFTYNGSTYRYLAGDIDTQIEVFNRIYTSLTFQEALRWYKNSSLIEFKGKMAQPEADGGSLLQWEKAKVEFIKYSNKTNFYRLVIPVGDTGKKEMRIVEFQKEKNNWKISKIPYADLDIPGNINPAFVFFKYLLVDSNVSQDQLVNGELNASEFKKGIKKIEVRELKEIARNNVQVEYAVKFNVELENGYKGSLNNGLNQMFFLIQQTDYMEFKIVSVGTAPHLLGE